MRTDPRSIGCRCLSCSSGDRKSGYSEIMIVDCLWIKKCIGVESPDRRDLRRKIDSGVQSAGQIISNDTQLTLHRNFKQD